MPKFMKAYFLLIVLWAVGISVAVAQQRTTKAISAGLELNIPQRSAYNIGYGVSGKFELPVTPSLSLSLTGGLHSFNHKSFNIGNLARQDNDVFIPIKGGLKYFFDPRFYTEGELGTVIDHNDGYSQNLFAYSLGTGFLLPLKNSNNSMIDIGIRFEDWSKNRVQQFAIRAAYRFGW
jgi:hypothetical protein